MIKRSVFLAAGTAALLGFAVSCQRDSNEPVRIETFAVAPVSTWANFANLDSFVLSYPDVRNYFAGDELRLLSVQPGQEVTDLKTIENRADSLATPTRLLALVYNVTKNQTVEVNLSPDGAREPNFAVVDYQPRPSEAEFAAARTALIRQYNLGADESVEFYPPMPPAVTLDGGQRGITVGVRSKNDRLRSGIYAVSARDFSTITDLSQTGLYHVDFGEAQCEIPPNFNCEAQGDGREVFVRIYQGGQLIWSFTAVRPTASSGHPQKGSGVELRYVRYKNRLVMWRGHVPILNVHYDHNACGPYRDWQNEETCFKCNGTNVAGTGFRICQNKPLTFADDHDDSGNFAGVGIYVQGQEVVLVSELLAGWYRYVVEWTFHTNGTIKPRFKFGGTANSCTCKLHFHHAYWRFDFDVNTSTSNSVEELKRNWLGFYTINKTFTSEDKAYRNANKCWRIKGPGGYYCDVRPGHHDTDGTGDAWAKGDVWVVKYRFNELEDGVGCVYCPGTTATIQDNVFLTGENVANDDVVVWYRASFDHSSTGHSHTGAEIVGPDIFLGGSY